MVPVVVLGREEDGLRVDMMELNIVVLPMTLLTVGATRVLVFTGINQLLVIVIVLVLVTALWSDRVQLQS